MVRFGTMGEPGRIVGRYELLLPIAKGGMGTVYLARARGIGGFVREVALKLVHEHLDGEIAQCDLLAEARIAARLRHPNAVPVLDVGESDGRPYIVMDYVEGDSLTGLAKLAPKVTGGRLPLPVALRAILESLAGLHAAHELVGDDGIPLGLVHRDYSPQNILLGLDGLARLTDFGVAKLVTHEATQSGMVKGKIRYMSPEQARGEPLDRRCDVWAGGVMLWEQLAGRKLFSADTDAATLLKIVTTKAPLLRDVAPNVHPALEDVVAGALQQDRAQRTPTALALRQGLAKALREADLAIEQDDVAAIVTRIVGPRIMERRARVAAGTVRDATPSSPAIIDATPSAPETPSSPPSMPPAAAVRTETTSGHSPLIAASVPPPPADAAQRRRIPMSVLIGVSAGLGAVGLFLIVFSISRSRAAAAAAAGEQSPAQAVASTSPPSPAGAAAPSIPSAATVASGAAAKPRAVDIRADVAIKEVRYLGSTIVVDPPRMFVALPAIPATAAISFEATSIDGRKRSATLPPDARSVTFAFTPP
jgi:serine/threonine-protein kinase